MTDTPDLKSAYALKTEDDNRRLYARWADTYDDDFVTATGYLFPDTVTKRYLADSGLWPCLDVGCGTGALGERFPQGAVVDGLDLSPEMLAVAERKACYRTLIQANLKQALPIEDAAYAGLVSAGTFTHGHVGPEALNELVRILRPGALALITTRPEVWETEGFGPAFGALVTKGKVSEPRIEDIRVYAPGREPDGRVDDMGLLVAFDRL